VVTVTKTVKPLSDAKAVTDFELDGITGETVSISSIPGTDGKYPIVVTVPPGTDITSLTPKITFTGGGSITPPGGTAPSSSNPYTDAPRDFSGGPVTYQITAEDGSSQNYTVTVIKPADTSSNAVARIDAFYFNNPVAIGTITQPAGDGNGTIAVMVPWDTNLTTLVPTIHFTGSKIRLGSNTDVTANPANIGADFSYINNQPAQVPCTVTALDGTTIKSYVVTVTPGSPPPPSDAKEITAFSFFDIDDVDMTTVISTMPDTSGDYPVEVIIPPGNNIEALKPLIFYRGYSIDRDESLIDGDGPEPEIKTAYTTQDNVNFTAPRRYTVTAPDGTFRTYVVTVLAEDNNEKEITGFYFTQPMAVGVIDEDAHSIMVKVPYGTDLSALEPTVFYKGVSLDPVSGAARNFSSPVIYNVKARNGTVQPYTVRVTPGQNNAKEITGFSFPGVGVIETVIGAVPDADGNVPISVTVSQNTVLGSLVPSVTHTGKAINPAPGSARDFRSPVLFTVTAEDGTTKDYAVSVHVSNNSSAVITGFVFNSVPVSGGSIQAVGAIDQDARTITVALPRTVGSAIPAGLTPAITYIGASITPSGGTAQTSNPFTDSARNFSSSFTYTVTAADSTAREYTVSVGFEKQNLGLTVAFQGIADPSLLTAGFNQSTGLLTLTINAAATTDKNRSGYRSPYEWYLDGKKFNASATETTLILHAKSLGTGQHQMVLFVYGKDDGLPYTNTVLFTVDE
jgi:hypothetical protein